MTVLPLPPGTPSIAVHYATGLPFRSMMDLDEAGRAAVLREGLLSGPARFQDPQYVETRTRVEAEMHRQLRTVGGRPLRQHPHYALLGRSQKAEAGAGPGKRAHVLALDRLPEPRVSFTWFDSFCFDASYREAWGRDHPAAGRIYRLGQLPEILERWNGSTGRPGWQEIEIQLWFDPKPEDYTVIELGEQSSTGLGGRGAWDD